MSVTSLRRYSTPISQGQGQGYGKDERDSRSSRATSVLSFLGVDRHDMMELFQRQRTSGVFLLLRMLSVVAVPAATVCLLVSITLYNAVVTHRLSNVAIDELQAFYQVDQLVTNLQVALSALFCSILYLCVLILNTEFSVTFFSFTYFSSSFCK